MSVKASGGSPVAQPQRYQTVPIAVISQAEQQDRWLKRSEEDELTSYFSFGTKLLEIATTLTQNADEIVSAGANRIFFWGSPMRYLEKPEEPIGLPGSGYYVGEDYLTAARRNAIRAASEVLKVQVPKSLNPVSSLWESFRKLISDDRDPLPGGFRRINISRYGPTRMKRSMRDLSWFLRYVTYAIVAGDSSILTVNVRGLRGVIPEDVTEATTVAMREMRWKSLSYFKQDAEATNIVKQYFDVLIAEYQVEKPSAKLRTGVSNDQQGLELPQSYFISAEPRPKFVMQPSLSATEKQEVIKAAYQQVFERDITSTYGFPISAIDESKVKNVDISIKEFIRTLGKSRLYRRLFYEPFVISRVVELAMRHFLGRGLSSREEFQEYFAIISSGGLPALVDALVDSQEYADYFGEETVPYLRGLGQEAQECRNWGPQFELFSYSAPVHKVPQFITLFANYQKPLPDQHPYGSGNDPLEIQFGAIFPSPRETRNSTARPAPFGKDSRRILISCGSGGELGSNGAALGKVPGSLGSRVLKLDRVANSNGKKLDQPNQKTAQGPSVSLSKNSTSTVIQGAYRQVFGRDIFEVQRLTTAEVKLKGGEITVRDFIRQLAKSNLFRSLYWEPLYITKAIEYIHRRLLGRPTYGRQEMNRYYEVCARQGFYALIDELVDSAEYREVFGEDTVPYERHLTPRGFALRALRGGNHYNGTQDEHQGVKEETLNSNATQHEYQGVKEETPNSLELSVATEPLTD